jgi:hypothetical protein
MPYRSVPQSPSPPVPVPVRKRWMACEGAGQEGDHAHMGTTDGHTDDRMDKPREEAKGTSKDKEEEEGQGEPGGGEGGDMVDQLGGLACVRACVRA